MYCDIITNMIEYYSGDPKRIQHFLKVYAFSKAIGEQENIPMEKQRILEITAILHDIGIKVSERKYNSSAGKYQEKEGPALAEELLLKLGYEKELIERVSFLIGHHHTYNEIDGIDYQILVEADFLVNAYEDNLSKTALENVKAKIFKTRTGLKYLQDMFLS